MKKFLICFATLFLLVMPIDLSAQAQEINAEKKKDIENLVINYDHDLGHEGRTKDEIITNLLNDGLSYSDAEYYAKMDILANQIEEQNIDISWVDSEVYSESYIKSRGKELRQKALNLDRNAIVALTNQNNAFVKGNDDSQQILKFNNENSLNSSEDEGIQTIEIKYPDGSSLVMEGETYKESELNEVEPQTLLSGPWNRDHMYDGINAVANNGGTFTTRTTWRFYAGSYASVTDVLRWKFGGKSDLTIDFLSDEGAASYAGVVKIDNENLSNHKTGYFYDEHVLQGYTGVRFSVTGTFSASFKDILSVSVNAGGSWYQYAISEVNRFPSLTSGAYGVYHAAGTYF